mgnify:CR=1 FL=1
MPKLKELSAKYADQGLVLIGIHSKSGAEKAPAFVADKGIGYPIALDSEGKTVAAFGVDSFPDYYVIDRSGKLRVADLPNAELEATIKVLLAEPVPASAAAAIPAPMQKAAAQASRKRTRILSVFGSDVERGTFDKIYRQDRTLSTLLRNEYQVASIDSVEHAKLMSRYSDDGNAIMVAHDESGAVLASHALANLDAKGLTEFLQAHRLPEQDAEVLWARAKSQAKRQNKRIFVHLGAPT